MRTKQEVISEWSDLDSAHPLCRTIIWFLVENWDDLRPEARFYLEHIAIDSIPIETLSRVAIKLWHGQSLTKNETEICRFPTFER